MSSLADETPEGRSIVELAVATFGLDDRSTIPDAVLVPFTAQTRMSGMDLSDGRTVRKGAADSVRRFVEAEGGTVPLELLPDRRAGVEGRRHPARRHRPADAGSDRGAVLGVIRLKDTVKPGMRERFDELRAMGIRTIMITGDNPLPPRPSPTRPASTTSSPRPRPRTRWR